VFPQYFPSSPVNGNYALMHLAARLSTDALPGLSSACISPSWIVGMREFGGATGPENSKKWVRPANSPRSENFFQPVVYSLFFCQGEKIRLLD